MCQAFRMVRVCHCRSTRTDAILATYIYEQGVDIGSLAITHFKAQMQPSSVGTYLPMARMHEPSVVRHNLHA